MKKRITYSLTPEDIILAICKTYEITESVKSLIIADANTGLEVNHE